MSTLRTNEIQRTDGQSILKNTGSIIQTVVLKTDTKATLDTTSWAEASSDYRVSITPTHADNRIYLTYYILVNANLASNTLFQLRAEKYTSGSSATITSRSTWGSASSRVPCDYIGRPGNGYDGNDQNSIMWECYDDPGSTSAQTYGFTYHRETGGSGTMYFGYSNGDNGTWGFHHPITIIAREVVQ